MTGDTGGKRLWNESAGYFIYHIHPISQSSTVNQESYFDSRGVGGENWDTAKWLTVTAWLFQLIRNQFVAAVCIKWIITIRICNVTTCPW